MSEILKPFKKFAVMYNQNLEIHSCWSFKQYLKFDYRVRYIHYYFKSKMFISPKALQTGNAKNPPLNRTSKYKPPGGLYFENCPQIQSKTKQKR